MNSWIGSRLMENTYTRAGFRSFVRDSELAAASPSLLWLIIDEHEVSIDDACFTVTMDDSRPFVSQPATRHERAYALCFTDAHAELYKLRDPNSLQLGTEDAQFSPRNSDWLQLKQVTTIK